MGERESVSRSGFLFAVIARTLLRSAHTASPAARRKGPLKFRNSYIGTGVDADVVRLAAKRAHSLIGKIGFGSDDLEDLQQELICAALEQLPKFDPERRGKLTFIGGVLDKKAAQLYRNRRRKRRDPYLESYSLDEPIPDFEEEGATYCDIMGDEDDRSWRLRDFLIDMRDALASLPPKLRALVELHAVMLPDQARQAAGLAKSVHHRAMKQVRQHFERAGFGPGAKKVGTNRQPTGNPKRRE